MPEDLESILSRSLDEVDRDRNRMKRTSIMLVLAVEAGLLALTFLSFKIDIKFLILWAAGLVVVAEVAIALRTWITVANSTRKVLKAIELLSKQ